MDDWMDTQPCARGWKIAAVVLACLLAGILAAGGYYISSLQKDLKTTEIKLESTERNLTFQKQEADRLREEQAEYKKFAQDVRRYMDKSGVPREEQLYQRAKDLGGLFYIGEIAEAQNEK